MTTGNTFLKDQEVALGTEVKVMPEHKTRLRDINEKYKAQLASVHLLCSDTGAFTLVGSNMSSELTSAQEVAFWNDFESFRKDLLATAADLQAEDQAVQP